MSQIAVERMPDTNGALVPTTPADMINTALSRGAGIDVIEKLMGLQERWEANQARKVFDDAISAAKAEIPVIMTNREGHNSKRYADFAAFARIVDPILSKHGLSYRFRATQGERISVCCVLSHRGGHSEETTLSGPSDTTGNKNAIQAIGSTLTYLQRYSLKLALGLASSDDDDGKAAGSGEVISEEDLSDLQVRMVQAGADIGRFCRYFKIETVADLPKSKLADAIAMIERKTQKDGK